MDELREQKIEALQVAHEYTGKLIKGIENVVGELSGERLADTDQYLDSVVKGLNWVIEVVNGTMDVINEKEVLIEKEVVNTAVKELGEALAAKDDEKIAQALKGGVLDFVQKVEKATAEY